MAFNSMDLIVLGTLETQGGSPFPMRFPYVSWLPATYYQPKRPSLCPQGIFYLFIFVPNSTPGFM